MEDDRGGGGGGRAVANVMQNSSAFSPTPAGNVLHSPEWTYMKGKNEREEERESAWERNNT